MKTKKTPRPAGPKLVLNKTTLVDLVVRSGVKTGARFSDSCGGCYTSFCPSNHSFCKI